MTHTNSSELHEAAHAAPDERVDLQTVRGALERGVPFNALLGLELLALDGERCTVRLPDADTLTNHLGTQHAAALFAAGEAASGGALLGAFGWRLASVRPVVTEASIRYRRPARGPISATAALPHPAAQLDRELEATGRSAFAIDVELADEAGTIVAELNVYWQLTASPGASGS